MATLTEEVCLRTQRLDIRRFVPSDISETYLGWLNDPQVTRYSNQRFRQHTFESAKGYLESFANSSNLFFVIVNRVSAKPIGTATVYRSTNHGTADIGLMIGDSSNWGRGFGLEAWQGILDWLLASPNIRKVTGGTASVNFGMIKIMERSGMHLEATRQQQEVIDGELVDIVYYARFAVQPE